MSWKYMANRILAREIISYMNSRRKAKLRTKANNIRAQEYKKEEIELEKYWDIQRLRYQREIEETNIFLIDYIKIEQKVEKHRKRFIELFTSDKPNNFNYSNISLTPNDMKIIKTILNINKEDFTAKTPSEYKSFESTVEFLIDNTRITEELKHKYANENIRLSIAIHCSNYSTRVIAFVLVKTR